MPFQTLLQNLRTALSHWWIVIVFGGIYFISQFTIGALLDQLGAVELGKLQVTGFTADAYLETFRRWEATGVMPFYRAHFVIDGIHWIWYAVSLTALLALALEGSKSPSKFNILLVFPLFGGLCDAFENSIQHVFLSDPSYAAIVDPLPFVSTLASITKWTLVSVSMLAGLALAPRVIRNRRFKPPQIQTHIDIDAPAETVWKVLTDLERYHEWNPFVVRARGTVAMHEILVVEPQMPGGGRHTFKPVITHLVPGREFAWTGYVLHPVLGNGEHIFRLEELDATRVRLVHDEKFGGLFAPLAVFFSGEQTREGFELMNAAVKRVAEAGGTVGA